MTGSFLHLKQRENSFINFISRIVLPSNKFMFVQFLVATNIKFANDFSSAFLWISIAFSVGFTDEIVLKRRRKTKSFVFQKNVNIFFYHRGDQFCQLLLVDLSIISYVVPWEKKKGLWQTQKNKMRLTYQKPLKDDRQYRLGLLLKSPTGIHRSRWCYHCWCRTSQKQI